jgi:site-specific recombinase XerC
MKPRIPTGSAFESRGRFYAKITPAPKDRQALPLPWCTSLPDALARAQVLQAMINDLHAASQVYLIETVVTKGGAADAVLLVDLQALVEGATAGKIVKAETGAKDGTFQKFAERWTSGELAKSFPDHVAVKLSSKDDKRILEAYVYPVVGPEPIGWITLDHYERVMAKLPAHLSSASRRHVAQAFRRTMQLATYPARVIAHNPIPTGALPKVKRTLAMQYLYPDEDRKLMAARGVDLGARVLFGVLARMGFRDSEVLGDTTEKIDPMFWKQVDLDRGVIYLDRNKTGDARPIPLDPATRTALEAWKNVYPGTAAPEARVFVEQTGRHFDKERIATVFRAALKAAGVTREELHTTTDKRKPIRCHDLRASFATVALANGRSETWVRDRTAWKSTAMVDRYRRLARNFEELSLGDWRPLDEAIPELCRHQSVSLSVSGGASVEVSAPLSSTVSVGWLTGFEPATAGSTIRRSTD